MESRYRSKTGLTLDLYFPLGLGCQASDTKPWILKSRTGIVRWDRLIERTRIPKSQLNQRTIP